MTRCEEVNWGSPEHDGGRRPIVYEMSLDAAHSEGHALGCKHPLEESHSPSRRELLSACPRCIVALTARQHKHCYAPHDVQDEQQPIVHSKTCQLYARAWKERTYSPAKIFNE